MLKICLIPPNPDMRFVTEYLRTGTQHVSLARALDDRRYESAFVRMKPRSQYTILDAATSFAVQAGDILNIANRIGADEIVLPCLLHSRASIYTYVATWKYFPPHLRTISPQGSSEAEIMETLEWGIQQCDSDVVAVALHDYIEDFVPREQLVHRAVSMPWFPKHLRFHMIGLRGNVYEQMYSWKRLGPRVRSVATAAPFVLASRKQKLDGYTVFTGEDESPNITAPYEASMENIKILSGWREDT